MATDRYLRSMLEKVEKFGWGLVHVGESCSEPGCTNEHEGEEPPFTYTVGLAGWGHPELLVHGLTAAEAEPLLNDLGERIRGGQSFVHGQTLGCEHCEAELTFTRVIDTSDLVVLGQLYADECQALQVVWRDWQHRYPWDKGYNRWRFPQQLAGLPPMELRA
ncbi:DUF4262 domain-containing protein [Pseudactinotalea terrae]|uniref:DUF4262 domain-containing protein n=1 Tax=Pseudactinotalea terrae TaxID=1743262 RepID=UPI0012E2BCA3|nr:DUF4262 domain-containing protein [Pseudactinotalea terrae]